MELYLSRRVGEAKPPVWSLGLFSVFKGGGCAQSLFEQIFCLFRKLYKRECQKHMFRFQWQIVFHSGLLVIFSVEQIVGRLQSFLDSFIRDNLETNLLFAGRHADGST